MSYPNFEAPERTDDDFRNKRDAEHHKVNGLTREFLRSPLEDLPIDMVKDFVIADDLHLLHHGIVKRILLGFKSGGHNFKEAKLAAQQVQQISSSLMKCNEYKPVELHRAIRGMDSLARWKGSEFRRFLLYLGPVVLKNIVSDPIYDHFILLFCSISICSCNFYINGGFIPLAEALISEFLEQYIQIYGIDAINNNLHSLSHLIDDIKRFGPLPNISSYPFESKLGQIKNLLRNGNRPLAQVVKRLSEMNNLVTGQKIANNQQYPYVKNKTSDLHKHPGCCKSFQKLYLTDSILLENNKKNQWFMTDDGEIVKMLSATYFQNAIHIYGSSLKVQNNFFNKPIESKHLNIFCSTAECNTPNIYELSSIKCKMVCLEYQSKFVFLPILHSLDDLNDNKFE